MTYRDVYVGKLLDGPDPLDRGGTWSGNAPEREGCPDFPSHGAGDLEKYPFTQLVSRNMNDTITGIVAFTMDAIGSILAQQRPGGLRIVAVLAEKRSPFAPDIPTAQEQGLNFTAGTFNPIALPKGTPTEIISRYAEATRRALRQPETMARLKNIGIEPLLDSTPEHCRSSVAAEVQKWLPVVAKLGLG